MNSDQVKPYKPPQFYQHSEINLKAVGNGNCTGMTVDDGNHLLVCDCYKSRVLIFDRNNRFLNQIDTKFQPWDITHLLGTTTAVISSYNGNVIEFIDLDNRKRLKWVTLEGSAIGGIASNKEHIFVGGTCKIHVLDHHGNPISNIKARSKGTIWYISLLKNGNFCYSDFYNTSCVKNDGSQVFSYKSKDLKNPQKICIDDHGNIYIIGYLSNNVHRLKSDGTFIDIVLGNREGIECPKALQFNKRYTKLFIANKDGTVIYVFNPK